MSGHCTKCNGDGHVSRRCEHPWPFHDKQECDLCGKGSSGHEAENCPNHNKPDMYCKECGHANHHYPKNCPIKNSSIDANVNQYTKSRYDLAMSKRQRSSANRTPIPDRTRADASSSRNPPGQGGSINSPSNRPAVRPTNQPPVTDSTNKKETSAPRRVKREQPQATDDEKEKLVWAKTKLDTVPSCTTSRDESIQSNFLKVSFEATAPEIRRYRIELGKINGKPVIKRELKRALIEKFLRVQRPPDAPLWGSDYFSYVVSVGKLYRNLPEEDSFDYILEHGRTPRPGDTPEVLETKICFEGVLDRTKLDQLVNKTLAINPDGSMSYLPENDLRTLNIVSWKTINDDCVFKGGRSGKKFYPHRFGEATFLGPTLSDDGNGGTIQKGKVKQEADAVYALCKGFFTSMRPGDGSLLLNINPVTTAFYPSILLQDWIDMRWGDSKGLYRQPPLDGMYELDNLRVTFEGDPLDPPKKRIVREVSSVTIENQEFYKKDETGPFTVLEHVRSEYPKLSFKPDALCVDVGNGSDKRIWYPSDQLRIVPWQPFPGKIDSQYTEYMLKEAERYPASNINSIKFHSFGPLGVQPPDEVLPPSELNTRSKRGSATSLPLIYQDFGITVGNSLLKIPVRYLNQPPIAFRTSSINLASKDEGKRTSWNLIKVKFLKPGMGDRTLNAIFLGTSSNEAKKECEDFLRELANALSRYGVTIRKGNVASVVLDSNDDRATLGNKLSATCRKWGSRQLLMVILPKKLVKTYADVKWWGDCSLGIPTICVTHKVMQMRRENRPDANMLGNLSLKANLKLGGTNHGLKDHEDWCGANDNTMIVGADVSHPGKCANLACPSMAGVVATNGKQCDQYLASARLQDSNTEFIENLDDMIYERLLAYYHNAENQKTLPDHILFYRDGVSESQYGMVKLHELRLIEKGCSMAGLQLKRDANWKPKITLLVVGKRHHSRFFKFDPPNPPPNPKKLIMNTKSGLVVDCVITDPTCSNFYLQSHESPLGTAKSGHYVVISNGSGYTMEELQVLTMNLCFIGARSTKCISVCAPARYADTLCDRLRQYMWPVMNIRPGRNDDTSLTHYVQDTNSWNGGDQAHNPWNSAINKCMFYL